MNRKLFLLLSLLFTSISFSQQAKIDSLSQIFHYEKEDSIKVRILAEIGEVAYSMNIEFAKQINDSLLSYAKGRSEKYLAQAYKVNGTFFLLEGNFDNALKYYKQSLKIFKKLNDKKNEAVVVGNFGTLYGRKGDIEESKKYHLQAIKINNEINNEEGNIKPYLNFAIAAGNESNFEESIEYLIKASSIAEVHNSNQNLPYI
jgi:tetratricopeptide (TPR) repeat protein